MEASGFDKATYDLSVNTGITYCYSKTIANESYPYHTRISLSPVATRPKTKAFSIYFDVADEPMTIASGIGNDTTAYLNLSENLMAVCYGKENTDH